MSRLDFYLVGGLSLALAYANLIGPHRLIERLYPDGRFVAYVLADALADAVARLGDRRAVTAAKTSETPMSAAPQGALPGHPPAVPAKKPVGR